MGAKTKTVVLTMYGKDEQMTDISIALFDGNEYYPGDRNAVSYCQNINQLKLQEGEWIYASVIDQNKKIRLRKPLDIKFDLIKRFNQEEMRLLFNKRDVTYTDLAISLKDETINDTIFFAYLNKPSRDTPYWIENFLKEYENTGAVNTDMIKTAQQKVTDVIKSLVAAGKIVID